MKNLKMGVGAKKEVVVRCPRQALEAAKFQHVSVQDAWTTIPTETRRITNDYRRSIYK